MERSDIYEFYVDEQTGFISNKVGPNSKLLKTPCAFRLLMQEIAAMGVKPQLLFKESDEEFYDTGIDESTETYDIEYLENILEQEPDVD
jgi:hypothetical protein